MFCMPWIFCAGFISRFDFQGSKLRRAVASIVNGTDKIKKGLLF